MDVVGREAELAGLRAFVAGTAPRRTLVLTGAAGFGKTTLWEAGIAAARERGLRVLVARPSGAEAGLSFTALIDLCDGIDTSELSGLPELERSALEVALLRASPTGAHPDPQTISLGFRGALRALAARAPLLVAVDDVQWLDPPSADVLAFAARRIGDANVAFLLARRPGAASALELELERTGPERLDVGPLSLDATRRLLSDRLALSLSRALLRRVVESTLGNPLFALELGRTLVERGLPEIGDDIPLPDAVEDMLGTRVGRLPGPTRRLLLALALSAGVGTAELTKIAGAAAVADAVDAGVLVTESERVRASHPLLAAAARQRSRPAERREVHHALAGAVADAELRALHLALAREQPDAGLATTIAAAAAAASARGARQDAVRLSEHALRLTPAGAAERSDRLLALAAYLETAGELQRMTDVLTPELDSLPSGAPRARAWLLLCEGTGVRSLADLERHLESALAECADEPGLRAQALAERSSHTSASAVAQLPQAEAWALEALADARHGSPDAERLALSALGWARSLRGQAIDELCERFEAASESASYIADSPVRVAGQRLVWRGEIDAARALLGGLLSLADERGEPSSYALQRLHLCELELRIGGWDAAARLLDEWAESADAELLLPPMYERCRALLAAGRGLPDEVERWAAQAIAGADATGVRWDRFEAERARGIAALFAHDPERAAERLRPVWEHTRREGVDDPGTFPVAPDLVEALAAIGAFDEALVVTGRLRELAERQEHPWGRTSAQRSEAVLRLASTGYDEQTARSLDDAATGFVRLGLPFDGARALLTLGRAQRRHRRRAAARAALERAAAAFDAIGSAGWAEQARAELARIGARGRTPNDVLTPAQRRVAELAVAGHSNKEIAQTLYIAVHTVERHLSQAYAKLGIHSRSQLAGRLRGNV